MTFENQRVVVDATLTAPGILALSEVAYPGWTVRANGEVADAAARLWAARARLRCPPASGASSGASSRSSPTQGWRSAC